MISKKEIVEELGRLSTFKNIFETYEEIAASRMQTVRNSVLLSRNFIDELNDVFLQVKQSYKDKVDRLLKKSKNKDNKTFIKRNGKTIFVLLSANTGLYGDVIRTTFNMFINLIKREKADAVIVGRIGLELFKSEGMTISYNYFDFPDAKIDPEGLKKIVDYLIQYEKIYIVYGKFQNIISQEPVVTGISGDLTSSTGSTEVKVRYLFEPPLEKIMELFEKEIFASIFEQSMLESELAKFAARMTSLELRVERIKERLQEVGFEKEKLRHRTMNKKQLETFSTIVLWQ